MLDEVKLSNYTNYYTNYYNWYYNGEVLEHVPDKAVGFVYLITRLNLEEDKQSPMFYVGKKWFKTKHAPEDAWRSYYGSSTWLHEDIEKYGIHSFRKDILHITYSKSETTYKEIMEQVQRKVLKADKNNIMKKVYYNKNILGKFYSDAYFTKADVLRIKTYIDSADANYEKIAVTDGIITKYVNCTIYDIDEWLLINKGWIIGSTVHNNTSGKEFMTKGTKYKFIEEDLVQQYISKGWKYATVVSVLTGSVCVTDGTTNTFIPEDTLAKFIADNDGWYKGSKYKGMYTQVYNKVTRKGTRVLKTELDNFLLDNQEYTKDFPVHTTNFVSMINEELHVQVSVEESHVENMLCQGYRVAKHKETLSALKRWVNKDGIDAKVTVAELSEYLQNGWVLGRHVSASKGCIAIIKAGKLEYVAPKDLPSRLEAGWIIGAYSLGTLADRGLTMVCNEITKNQQLVKIEDLSKFLVNNLEWVSGYLKRGYGTTNNIVFAINVLTNTKVTISSEEFKAKPYMYVGSTSRKVVVSKNGTAIYSGYLNPWLHSEDLPEYPFIMALRGDGTIKNSGKYKYLAELGYTVRLQEELK